MQEPVESRETYVEFHTPFPSLFLIPEGTNPPKYPGLKTLYDNYFGIHGFVAASVCAWGICANIANIVVLTRKNMTSSTNIILTWLAVADLMTMLSYLPISIHFYILHDAELSFPSSRSYGWIIFMLFHISFSVLCHTIAIWLTITLAIFRYIYICHPMQGKLLCTRSRAKLAILAVHLLTAFLCIPHYMSTKIDVGYRPFSDGYLPNNKSLPLFNWSALFEQDAYYVITEADNAALLNFNYWIQSILVKLIPCILLTILTIMLIIAMHKANRRRQELISQGKKGESEREHETNRTTGMLLAVVTLFLVTELPQGILTLCSIFIPWFFSEVYISLGDMLDIAALLNNSINFVLYCTMSRQFRNTFVRTFCTCHCNTEFSTKWKKLRVFNLRTDSTESNANAPSDCRMKSFKTDTCDTTLVLLENTCDVKTFPAIDMCDTTTIPSHDTCDVKSLSPSDMCDTATIPSHDTVM